MKRFIALMTVLAVICAMFAACGSSGSPSDAPAGDSQAGQTPASQDESAPANRPITVTFGSHQSGLPVSGIEQELAKEFEELTGMSIDFQVTPDAQWRDLLNVKLNAGEAYDIMNVDADPLSIISRINPEQNCVDLSGEGWLSRIDPVVLPGVTVNDKVYGIQFAGTRKSMIVYNKQIFSDLGLAPPTTYDEWKQVCQAILDSGITPIYEATQNGWHQVLPLFETGSHYVTLYDDLYGRLNRNEMNVLEVKEIGIILGQMKEFAELGFFGDYFMSQSVEGAQEALATNQAAMFNIDTGWVNELETEFPHTFDNFGIFAAPWADNQTISVNTTCNAFFISKDSNYVNEIKEYFNFLASPENLKKRLEGDPSQESLCWPEVESRAKPEFQAYFNSLPHGMVMQVGTSYIDPQWMDVGKDIDAMYAGMMTPDEVFQNIANRRDEMARLQRDPAWQ
ncbi:MAG: ABC transporter substrate-binding protein [Oscillospiraceae bacterium]|nr:ABC transporter substrate-binding protein [Oscillospiraceae bacterium]